MLLWYSCCDRKCNWQFLGKDYSSSLTMTCHLVADHCCDDCCVANPSSKWTAACFRHAWLTAFVDGYARTSRWTSISRLTTVICRTDFYARTFASRIDVISSLPQISKWRCCQGQRRGTWTRGRPSVHAAVLRSRLREVQSVVQAGAAGIRTYVRKEH